MEPRVAEGSDVIKVFNKGERVPFPIMNEKLV